MTYNSDPEDKDERSWIEKKQDEDIEAAKQKRELEKDEKDGVDVGEVVSMVVDSIITGLFF